MIKSVYTDTLTIKYLIFLLDIIVKCGPDDIPNPLLDELVLTIGDVNAKLDLKKISQGEWQHEGEVETCVVPSYIFMADSNRPPY